MESEKKAFGTTLRFNNAFRHVMFVGDDTDEQNRKFDEALAGLSQIGDLCKNPEEFFNKAISYIQNYGFHIIKK